MSLWLHNRLPFRLAAWLSRWRLILRQIFYFHIARSKPQETRANILLGIRQALGPEFDVEQHFGPRYHPWESATLPGAR